MEGRGRGGGLRLGEMERDCLISHGASQVLHDRFLMNSDHTVVTACNRCGLFARQPHSDKFARGLQGHQGVCSNCMDARHCKPVAMPYAAKLFFQELFSLGVVVRMTSTPAP